MSKRDEAMQFDGSNGERIEEWSGGKARQIRSVSSHLLVETKLGFEYVLVGGYVICDVDGEFVVASADDFVKDYAPLGVNVVQG